MVRTSLICTCYNEAESIDRFLDSILAQTKMPDEIVIVDGGSTDGTYHKILSWSAKLPRIVMRRFILDDTCNLKFSKSPVAKGRNRAINEAIYNRIIVVDAGCVYDSRFIEEIIKPNADVVGGWTEIEEKNDIQQCASILFKQTKESMKSILNASSRAICFNKKDWARVGGYPEVTLSAEDTFFNKKLNELGLSYTFTDKAIVTWSAPDNLKSLLKDVAFYSYGDGICGLQHKMYISKIIKVAL